jgi:hypothetical protein
MYPHGLRQSPVGGANNFPPVLIPVKNVTASTLTRYGVYQLDIAQTDGDVTTVDKALSSVIAVATAGIATGILVVVQSAIAAGEVGMACVAGTTLCLVDGMDVLKAQNADTDVVKATPATDRWHAIALEGQTSSTPTAVKVLWDGFGRF